ncbi:DUF6875 domain-containing protein [Mesorhizobium sp. 128a]
MATHVKSAAGPNASPQPAETNNLFLPDQLEDAKKAGKLTESDFSALHSVADWIMTFVARPHRDLGRTGPVCPFVPTTWDQKALWLAPERIVGLSALDVTALITTYQRLLLKAQPAEGKNSIYKSIVIVFTDLSTHSAKALFDEVLRHVGIPAYAENGLVLGGFYPTNEGGALYNPSFRPFAAPVPFVLIRPGVISDWKFFLDDENRLELWAGRYGKAAVSALAEELRRLPWRRGEQLENGQR